MELKKAVYRAKEQNGIPPGVEILKKESKLEIEEIENGFLLTKNAEIQYVDKNGDIQWIYPCKKYFSKTNPLSIKEELILNKF